MSAQHSHKHDAPASSRRALTVALLLTATFLVVEAVGGVITGSLALVSDAGHMLSDAAALALSLLAVWLASRPHTHRRTYGYHRAEILAALANGVVLAALALYLLVEAIQRLSDPPDVDSVPMLAIACTGLAVNLLAGIVLVRAGDGSLNVRSAAWHVAGDALGSVGAIVAGVIMVATGWYLADPLVSIAIAALIFLGGLRITREALSIVLESAPRHLDMEEIRQDILRLPNVTDVHDLHVWTITSGFIALSAHVRIEPSADPAALVREASALLSDRFDIHHATIQPESEPLHAGVELGACCLGEHAATAV